LKKSGITYKLTAHETPSEAFTRKPQEHILHAVIKLFER